MKTSFLLIPVLLMFSCGKTVSTTSVDAGICPRYDTYSGLDCPDASPKCTPAKIEACFENCAKTSRCFFSWTPKTCLKKCSTTCLNESECKWATE